MDQTLYDTYIQILTVIDYLNLFFNISLFIQRSDIYHILSNIESDQVIILN